MFWLAATVMRPEAFSLSVQTHYLSMKARGVPYAPARGSSSFKAWEEHFTLFDLTATPLRNIYGNHKHHCPPVTGVKCNICSSESTDSTSEMSLSGHSERLRGFSGCFVILLSWFCLCLFLAICGLLYSSFNYSYLSKQINNICLITFQSRSSCTADVCLLRMDVIK